MAKKDKPADAGEPTAPTEATKPQTNPGEAVFIGKGTGSEYPLRFEKAEIRYRVLVPVAGDPHATLDVFLRDFCKVDATAEEQAQIVADYFNGYGLTYRRNGVIKRVLNDAVHKDKEVAEVIAIAAASANEDRIGVVAKRGEGTRKSAKVKEAEGERDAAVEALRESYMLVPAAARRTMREKLLAKGGRFTAELLDGWDAEAEG
jgi:hypothetical protein